MPSHAAFVVGAAMLAAVAAGAWHLHMFHRAGAAALSVRQLQGRVAAELARAGGNKSVPVVADFTQRLPKAASAETVVSELQQGSAASGVAFVSVSVGAREPTAQTLGRTDVSVTLRGTYPSLKGVVSQALDRFPGLVLQRMSLRRMTSLTEVEAQVSLVLVTQALPAPAVGP